MADYGEGSRTGMGGDSSSRVVPINPSKRQVRNHYAGYKNIWN